MNNSRTDLVEMETKDKVTHRNDGPTREERRHFDCKKCFAIGIAVVIVILLWLAVLGPLIAIAARFIALDDGTSIFYASNLLNLLPPINYTNSTNYTIVKVDCIENFVYVPGEEICYPGCNWSPRGEGATTGVRILLIVLSVLGIVLGSVTLIAWLLTSCVDWKKLRFSYHFQLARTSLFMVVLCNYIVILTNACVDFIDRSVLFCNRAEDGGLYITPHKTYTISDNPNIRIVTNLIGGLYDYFFAVNLCWIAFSIVNILVIVFFPFFRESFRKRLFVFAVQFAFSFGFNLIPVAVTFCVGLDTTYFAAHIGNHVLLSNIWSFLILFVCPSVLLPSFVISLVVVVLTKLRINSIRSLETSGRVTKLTNLEKRLVWYCILIMALLFLYGIITVLVAYLIENYMQSLAEYTICITVNSPVVIQPNQTLTHSNRTVSVYRENPFGGVDVCNSLKDTANMQLPYFIHVVLALYLRFIWMPIFIVLVPHFSIGAVIKSIKGITSKYRH